MPYRKLLVWIGLSLGVAMGAFALETARGAEPKLKNSWEVAIGRFEEADKAQPTAPGGIVFVGSSSIRLWDLEESFPDQPLLNRGFGGSHLSDSVEFADRLVIKHRPRLVVLYAGDNDLAAGKTPEQIRDDFRAFVAKIHAALPEAKIVFLAIKPSLARAKLADAQLTANRLIADEIAQDKRLAFIDVGTPLLDSNGKPRPELFVKDGLHLSKAGYEIWNGLVGPILK